MTDDNKVEIQTGLEQTKENIDQVHSRRVHLKRMNDRGRRVTAATIRKPR